jgi:hypothetical protein
MTCDGETKPSPDPPMTLGNMRGDRPYRSGAISGPGSCTKNPDAPAGRLRLINDAMETKSCWSWTTSAVNLQANAKTSATWNGEAVELTLETMLAGRWNSPRADAIPQAKELSDQLKAALDKVKEAQATAHRR